MRKEFGERCCEHCGECCNHQLNNRKDQILVCIAFDDKTAWDKSETACGLFNVPFRGIRPKRLPLGEFLEKSARIKGCAESMDQQSFF